MEADWQNNKTKGRTGVCEGVLERERATGELEQTLSRLRATLEATADGILVVDLQGRIVDYNERFLEIWQFPRELIPAGKHGDLLGMEIAPVAMGFVLGQLKEPETFLRRVQELYAAPEEFSFDLLEFKDGRAVERYSLPQRVGGLPAGRVWSFRDVTERRRAEQSLRQSEILYRTLFESAQDAIFLVDADRLIDCNSAALRMFRCELGQIVGATPAQFSPSLQPDGSLSSEKVEQRLRATFGGAPQFFEWRHCRLDGSEFDAEVSLSRVQVRERWFVHAIIRDITERKRAEAALQRYQEELEERVAERTAELTAANRELETFVSAVSHDLRAPLRSIEGFGQLLLEEYAGRLDEEGRGYVRKLRGGASQMGQLIDALLRLSRAARGELRGERINLSEVAREIAGRFQREHPERDVQWVIASGMVAEGDAALLRSVLENLLSNAFKFTAKQPRGHIEFGKMKKEDQTVYYVRDNGAGFSAEAAGGLFIPFRRLHPMSEFPGTGIGLATVRQIIERHGGEAWAEGAPDKGATFYFTMKTRLPK